MKTCAQLCRTLAFLLKIRFTRKNSLVKNRIKGYASPLARTCSYNIYCILFIQSRNVRDLAFSTRDPGSSGKTLGVTVDDQHLSWKSDTDIFCRKITSEISALRRLKDFVDRKTLLFVYNAIIRPYFDYCCEVWDVFSETPCNINDFKNFKIEPLELS